MDGQRVIARRMVVGLPPGGLTPQWERDFSMYTPAGVIVFGRDFASLEALRALTARLRGLAGGRRIFISLDEEGGFVSQLGPHLAVPPNAALLARGAMPGDIEWAHRVTGERLRALGFDWVFAPVADVHSEARNPVIGPRSFGSDPESVGRAVGEAVRGLRAGGVSACLKHFPGHGDTVLDSHLALPSCAAPLGTLEAREFAPFRANLDAESVMTAHVVYPALDPARPGTFSRAVSHDLLRGKLGYRGISITDALEMKGASEGRAALESARLALEAGCDLLLFAFHSEEIRRVRLALADELVDGKLDRANFDAARPRLAAFDAARSAPGPEDLARPIADLTPVGWEERLEGIVGRGLRTQGVLPAGDRPFRVEEPSYAYGPSLADLLATRGTRRASGDEPAVQITAINSRVPLAPTEVERLREACRTHPTALIALSADAFLDDVPEAALRISALDATPLTRRVVADLLRTHAGGA